MSGETRTDVRAPLRWPRLRSGTFVAIGCAALGTVLAWADPFASSDPDMIMVSSRSPARRLFPELGDADPSKATIEVQVAGQPKVRLIPGPDGVHQVFRGETLLGPSDPDAFDGLWSSLRMATALRPVTKGTDTGMGKRGWLRVALPHQSFTLELGEMAPGDAGVFGKLATDDETWVIESEMLWLLEQPADKWLTRRLLPIEPENAASLAWGEALVLTRSDDGFWRVASGDVPALLSNEAVEFRLGRLLQARLDPLFEREQIPPDTLRPYLSISTLDGESRALQVGGTCPGFPDRRVVDRGPGLFGCLDAELFDPWTILDRDTSMIEGRLVPHRYGRIVQIDLVQPAERALIRRGGVWLLSEGGRTDPVVEDEVSRWYANLGRIEVEALMPESAPAQPGVGGELPVPGSPGGEPSSAPPVQLPFNPDLELAIHADTGEILRIRCETLGRGEPEQPPVLCRRDDAHRPDAGREPPLLRVLGQLPRSLAFEAETFADRRLIAAAPGEVRELEIRPGHEGAPVVRQSVEQDMGVWRIEAPVGVDQDGVLDEVRLETLLATLSTLRADGWRELPGDPPLRRMQITIVPEQGVRRTVELELYPGCIVAVDRHQPALIENADCAVLGEDLLFDDPLRFWLEAARAVELVPGVMPEEGLAPVDRRYVLRQNDRWVSTEFRPLDDPELEQRLQSFIDWRSLGIRSGEPPTPVEWSLEIRRDQGPNVRAELGQGWVRLRGADWYYVQRTDAVPEGPDPSEPVPFDPEAIEVEGE